MKSKHIYYINAIKRSFAALNLLVRLWWFRISMVIFSLGELCNVYCKYLLEVVGALHVRFVRVLSNSS